MRVNINLAFDVVEEIDAGQYSVDMADFNDAGMGPDAVAGAVRATIEDAARKARGERTPGRADVAGSDYPLDPDQD